jgi:hypothetical protein
MRIRESVSKPLALPGSIRSFNSHPHPIRGSLRVYALKATIRIKIKGRVETQPRFKIQYPMKNHCKDAGKDPKRCKVPQFFFQSSFT